MKAARRCRSTSPFAIWSSQAAQQMRRLVLSMAAATGVPKSPDVPACAATPSRTTNLARSGRLICKMSRSSMRRPVLAW